MTAEGTRFLTRSKTRRGKVCGIRRAPLCNLSDEETVLMSEMKQSSRVDRQDRHRPAARSKHSLKVVDLLPRWKLGTTAHDTSHPSVPLIQQNDFSLERLSLLSSSWDSEEKKDKYHSYYGSPLFAHRERDLEPPQRSSSKRENSHGNNLSTSPWGMLGVNDVKDRGADKPWPFELGRDPVFARVKSKPTKITRDESPPWSIPCKRVDSWPSPCGKTCLSNDPDCWSTPIDAKTAETEQMQSECSLSTLGSYPRVKEQGGNEEKLDCSPSTNARLPRSRCSFSRRNGRGDIKQKNATESEEAANVTPSSNMKPIEPPVPGTSRPSLSLQLNFQQPGDNSDRCTLIPERILEPASHQVNRDMQETQADDNGDRVSTTISYDATFKMPESVPAQNSSSILPENQKEQPSHSKEESSGPGETHAHPPRVTEESPTLGNHNEATRESVESSDTLPNEIGDEQTDSTSEISSGTNEQRSSGKDKPKKKSPKLLVGGRNFNPGSEGWDPREWGIDETDPDFKQYEDGVKLPVQYMEAVVKYARAIGIVEDAGDLRRSNSFGNSGSNPRRRPPKPPPAPRRSSERPGFPLIPTLSHDEQRIHSFDSNSPSRKRSERPGIPLVLSQSREEQPIRSFDSGTGEVGLVVQSKLVWDIVDKFNHMMEC